jgi:hypothetical protein
MISEYDEEMRQAMRDALPQLKKIEKMCQKNLYLKESVRGYDDAIEEIRRCVKFDIWTISRRLEYGIGIYWFTQSIGDPAYDSSHPQELLRIGFPTGAYSLGKDYDVPYFEKFYAELKEKTEPDYCWDTNHDLYYKPEKARQALNTYKELYKVYLDGMKDRKREFEIEQTKAKLERLMAERGTDE